MSENRTLQVFKKLSKKELKSFEKFVHSPIYNQHKDVITLFEFLRDNINKEESQWSSELIFEAVFPKEKFEVQKLHYVNSYLLKLIEQFFAWTEWQSEEKEQQSFLLRAYRTRNMNRHFDRVLLKLEGREGKVTLRNRAFFLRRYQRLIEKVKADSGKRSAKTPLQALSDAQDISFIIEKLYNACTMLSHQAVVKKEYNTGLLEPMLEYLKKSPWLEEPAIAIYYYSYQALASKGDSSFFERLKLLLQEGVNSFTSNELKDHYLIAINFCIRQVNQGNQLFLREAFELYKSGLAAEVFYENGELSRWTYNNMVVAGLRLKEFNWVKDFIFDEAERLPAAIREENKNQNLAHYFYEIKDYDQAMQLLIRTDYDNILHNMFGKMLLAKMYYELKEQSALDNLLMSFKAYIQRKKGLGYHKTNYLNFIKYTKRLTTVNFFDKVALEKLKTQMSEEQYLVERKWLLERVGALK